MRVMALRHPAGLDALRLEDRPAPQPGPGEVRVRWRASTLNFHDYCVAAGLLPAEDGRIPMSDGAGEVLEIGEGVTAWKPGDRVLSGNVVVVGVLGGLEARLNLHLLIGRQPRIQAIAVGSRRMQEDMVRALEASTVRPVIDRSFPLENLADAFRYQASGRHFGKIALEMP